MISINGKPEPKVDNSTGSRVRQVEFGHESKANYMFMSMKELQAHFKKKDKISESRNKSEKNL